MARMSSYRIDPADSNADGLILVTLTGRAQYTGGDASATIQLAQKADYPRPRAVSPDVPPALVAVSRVNTCRQIQCKIPQQVFP